MTVPGDVKGIEVLLMKMRRAPDSILLRERVLALLADLPDNEEKVRLTIELADVVRKGDPLAGLRVAWMAYQYDRTSIAALSGIAESLRRLGRDGKAEQVRMEIERLRNGRARGKHATTFELDESDLAQTHLDRHGDGSAAGGDFDDRTMAISIDELEDAKRAWRAGIDRQIEEEEERQKDLLDDQDGEETGKRPRRKKGALKLVKARESIRKEKEAPAAVRPVQSPANRPSEQDPVFSEVDQLMKSGEHFAAMIEIRKTVAANLTPETANKALIRLRVVWERLGLTGFEWQDSDGVHAFLKKVKRPQLPTMAGLLATPRTED